jgi:hypothetical protein
MILGQLARALLLGSAIGFERQWNQKMVRLQTPPLGSGDHIPMSLGADQPGGEQLDRGLDRRR